MGAALWAWLLRWTICWVQGHFQVLFDREHCPIFQHKLSWLQRIMYLQV